MPPADIDGAIASIRSRLASNLERVRGVVAAYDELGLGAKGRRSVRDADLLRASVVLLHATMEDLLRSLAGLLLPLADRDTLEALRITFVGAGDRTVEKLSLSELAGHRGRSVDEVIRGSIKAWLDRSSYNNLRDLSAIVKAIGCRTAIIAPHAAELAIVMKRRHWIVHQADRNEFTGPGHHPTRSISKSLVASWIRVVESLGDDLLAEVVRGRDA